MPVGIFYCFYDFGQERGYRGCVGGCGVDALDGLHKCLSPPERRGDVVEEIPMRSHFRRDTVNFGASMPYCAYLQSINILTRIHFRKLSHSGKSHSLAKRV